MPWLPQHSVKLQGGNPEPPPILWVQNGHHWSSLDTPRKEQIAEMQRSGFQAVLS